MRIGSWLVAMVAATLAVPACAATDVDRAATGIVVAGAGAACGQGSSLAARRGVIAGCDPAGGLAGATDLDLMFVDPADPAQRGATRSFSMLVGADARALVTAYDASGRLLGVADRIDDEAAGGAGQRLILTGLGDIARVHISGRGPIAYADLRFDEVTRFSRLPEPATWAMLLTGLVLTAAAIRRRIRLSEVRFTDRVRRIASGEAD